MFHDCPTLPHHVYDIFLFFSQLHEMSDQIKLHTTISTLNTSYLSIENVCIGVFTHGDFSGDVSFDIETLIQSEMNKMSKSRFFQVK